MDLVARFLWRAQDQWRESEAAQQAAIRNALPACIAVLDVAGRVLSVNDRWGRLTAGNTLHGPAYGVGTIFGFVRRGARTGLYLKRTAQQPAFDPCWTAAGTSSRRSIWALPPLINKLTVAISC